MLMDTAVAIDAGEVTLDADLVVLAACDTGAGGAGEDRTGLKGGGEALGGLARAMIYAGSRGMVVSHWAVESVSAARLMTALFASRAPTLAGGLRQAQMRFIQDPAVAHPFYWAPFTVVGDGGRTMPGAAETVAAAAP
jgi:CHAT domain-containing protein